jgi:hypothetical protein
MVVGAYLRERINANRFTNRVVIRLQEVSFVLKPPPAHSSVQSLWIANMVVEQDWHCNRFSETASGWGGDRVISKPGSDDDRRIKKRGIKAAAVY